MPKNTRLNHLKSTLTHGAKWAWYYLQLLHYWAKKLIHRLHLKWNRTKFHRRIKLLESKTDLLPLKIVLHHAGKFLLGTSLLIIFFLSWSLIYRPAVPSLNSSLFSDYYFSAKNDVFAATIGDKKSQTPTIEFSAAGHKLAFSLDEAKIGKSVKKGNQVIFKNVLDSIDLSYQTLPKGIKEELILHQIPTQNSFIFTLNTFDTSPAKVLNNFNAPIFYDKAGEYLFHFDKPFAYDSKGAKTQDVVLQIEKSQSTGRFIAKLTVDSTWLTSPDREYPVYIDPTIVHDTSAEYAGQKNRVTDTGSGSFPNLETYYQELPADEYTAALWHMNEASANTCTGGTNDTCDASGNVLDGAFNGNAAFTTSAILGASAVSLDGTNSYIQVSDNNAFSFANNTMSAEAWIKRNGNPAATEYFILKGIATWEYGVYVTTGGKVAAILWTSAGAQVATVTSNFVVTDGNWHHAAFTSNGSVISIYIDGILDNSSTSFSSAMSNTASNFYMGDRSDVANAEFEGSIDEIRLSNVARTAEEIKAAAQRRPNSVYTSDVIDLTKVESWTSFSWDERGVATGDGETASSSANLIAQWNFNETGANANNDAEGTSCGGAPNDCDGVVYNLTANGSQDSTAGSGWTAANKRWGAGALMFDGTDDYMLVNYTSALNPSGSSVTLEAWVNPRSLDTSDKLIAHTNANMGYTLRIDDADANNLEMYIGDGSNYHYCTKSHGMKPGGWYHLAGTFDGSTYNLFVNGKSIGSCSDSFTPNWGTTGLAIGGAPDYFSGTIDTARVYGRALPAHEILSNAQAGNIELQTRVGADTSPDDGSWEEWRPVTSEVSIDNMDNPLDWATPSASLYTGALIATSSSSVIKAEGNASLKLKTGQVPNPSNFLGVWNLDETIAGGNGAIKDVSGNGNHLTTKGSPATVDGPIGKARSFNGTSDYICTDTNTDGTCDDNNNFDALGGFTVSAWIKTDTTASQKAIISKIQTTGNYDFLFTMNSGGAIRGWVCNTVACGAGAYSERTSSSTIVPGTWYHVVMTWSPSSYPNIYINGALNNGATGGTTFATESDGAGPLYIGGRADTSEFWDGAIDEAIITDRAVSAEEVMEQYRAGANHRITKTLSSTDFSGKTTIPFYVAADRPGTYLSATIGESSFANNEPDANTVLFWRLDEVGGSGAYFEDSSGNGLNGTANSAPSYVPGKIGGGRKFDAVDDSVYISDTGALDLTSNITLSAWIYPTSSEVNGTVATKVGAYYMERNSDNKIIIYLQGTSSPGYHSSTGTVANNVWSHVAMTFDGSQAKIYINGVLDKTVATTGSISNSANAFYTGSLEAGFDTYEFGGVTDEIRIDSTVRSADTIRQAYEAGRRTHPITIDFNSSIAHSDPLSDSNDLTFTLTATASGSTSPGSNLYKGDKIIVRENYDGTEYIAQGTVTAVTVATGAVTVAAWDSGSTFPSGGYTPNATVFKWQREYFDVTGLYNTHIDATTNLSLRLTDGNEGRTIWLDDFRSTAGFLTTPGGSTITSSSGQQYFQYRIVNTVTDTVASPAVRSLNLDYTANTAPATPTINASYYHDKVKLTDQTPEIRFSSTDDNSNDIVYEIAWDTDSDFAAATTKASDADAGFTNVTNGGDTSPFTSGNTISYTFQTNLTNNTTYYYRVRAKDPTGLNSYSDWSTTRSFTVDTAGGSVLRWFETDEDQFSTDTLDGPNLTVDTTNNTVYLSGSNYQQEKSITLTNSGGTLTDYDTLVTVDTASLITGGKMQADCDDIRFYNSDKSTTLTYWLEGGCNTSTTHFWVQVPSIPNGDKVIWMKYNKPSDTSGSQSWSGSMVLPFNGSCPTGWTAVTGLNSSNRFPYGSSSSYGTTGGDSTAHSHAVAGTSNGSGDGSYNDGGCGWGINNHSHDYSLTSGTTSNEPPYVDVVYCSYDSGIPATVATSAIGMFDTLPSGWSSISQDAKFPRGAASYGGTGGSQHNHSVSGNTGNNSGGALTISCNYTATGNIWAPHGHSTSFNLANANNLPPYYDVIGATRNSTGIIEGNLIAGMTTSTVPPMGWSQKTSLNSVFPRYNSTSGGTGGASTHTHTWSSSTTGYTAGAGLWRSIDSGSSNRIGAHSHGFSGTTADNTNNLPSYSTLVYMQRDVDSVTKTYGNEVSLLVATLTTPAITAANINASATTWRHLNFTDSETGSDIKYSLYYDNAGTPTIIPDNVLTGNSTGFDTSPVSLTVLSTTTYPIIYVRATFTYTSDTPILSDWTVSLTSPPNTPTLDSPINGTVITDTTPALLTTGTDPDSDYLRYKIEMCTDLAMTANCQTFDQTSSQTGWSGQNTQTSTAYTSDTQATYTVQTPLTWGQTYYWRSYTIDPADTNTWSSTQSPPEDFILNSTPTIPTLLTPADTTTGTSLTPTLTTIAPDPNGDYLRYKIELCTNSGMTANCQTFDQTSSQTGWSGQNTQGGTAYISFTQAAYTLQSALNEITTYYWRSYAADPGGTNTWSGTQASPFSFTTVLYAPNTCKLAKTVDNASIVISWVNASSAEDGYYIEKNTDSGGFANLITKAADSTSHTDSAVSSGHTYSYRIRSTNGANYSTWCTTGTLTLGSGSFQFEGLKLEGVKID